MKKMTARQELQQIHGIGDILAQRLIAAGNDSCAKVAALGAAGLRQVKGINQKAVESILAQAQELAEQQKSSRDARIEALRAQAAELRRSLESIALQVREQKDEMSDKLKRKLDRRLATFLVKLDAVEKKAHKRIKRTGRGLKKATKSLTELVLADSKSVLKGIKKARKNLKQVQK